MYANNDNVRGVFKAPANEPITSALDIEEALLFNPEEYTLNKDNNFASQAIPGLTGPLLQFVHGNMRTLEVELFFDTTEPPRDVRDETQKVVRLLDIASDLHAPPVLRVSWASLQFRCVLARVGQKFVRFLEDGRPVRARLTVTFNEYIDPDSESKEVNRQTANFSKVHVVKRGDTLSGIASSLYGAPQSWRPIARPSGFVASWPSPCRLTRAVLCRKWPA